MATDYFVPGYGVVIETTEADYFLPGYGVLIETEAAAAAQTLWAQSAL